MSVLFNPFDFSKRVDEYINQCSQANSRLKAYDICHEKFANAITKGSFDYDELALHLYAFLASYGMVCRKGILLQHNYKFLIDVVTIVCNKRYAFLLDIDIFSNQFNKNLYIQELLCLKKELSKSLNITTGYNSTLISKIIFGTLGCVPAYDQFVCESLKELNMCQSFSNKGLSDILEFAKKHKTDIINLQKKYASQNINYSVMKLVDCALWIR